MTSAQGMIFDQSEALRAECVNTGKSFARVSVCVLPTKTMVQSLFWLHINIANDENVYEKLKNTKIFHLNCVYIAEVLRETCVWW